ncbi:MAG: glycosyltransferase family 4 protein [Candidatus Methanoperedens sp.]|nr:glycosyltransferase family 4 protein [Candidatus Methanoperedens sp.]
MKLERCEFMWNKNKPIKVLFVSHTGNMYGGAEKSLLQLLKNIDRKRIDPVVIIPRSGLLEVELNRSGIRTYKVKYTRWVRDHPVGILTFFYCIILELLALPRFIYIIKKEKINVVYTNTIVIFSGAISAFITRIPHIWHIREIIKNNPDLSFFFRNKLLLDFIMEFSNRIIAISQAVANQFSVNNLNKIKVVPNAVNFHVFDGCKSFPDINGTNPEDYLVAVIGTLQKRKGQDYAIRGIKAVNWKVPNIKLLLIGKHSNNYKKYLEKLVAELGLSGKVIFTGYRNDVPQILPFCKILLMPSLDEPFGRITIEAMAAGVPVIGVNSGGTKEIIQDGVTGYLVSTEDPSEMAERIIKLYDNPELAKKIGNNGKKLVLKKYNMETHIQSIEKVIIETIC